MADKAYNNQSSDLVEQAKARGVDPSKIWDQAKGAYVEDISAWDHPREPYARGLGQVPADDLPKDFYGKDWTATDPTGGPVMEEKVTFNTTNAGRESRENGNPKRTLSNPTDAMPGA